MGSGGGGEWGKPPNLRLLWHNGKVFHPQGKKSVMFSLSFWGLFYILKRKKIFLKPKLYFMWHAEGLEYTEHKRRLHEL